MKHSKQNKAQQLRSTSCVGTGGRVVSFDTKRPGIKSSHWELFFLLLTEY